MGCMGIWWGWCCAQGVSWSRWEHPAWPQKRAQSSGFGFGVFGEPARGSWGLGEWELCPVLAPKWGLQLLSEGWGISRGWECCVPLLGLF